MKWITGLPYLKDSDIPIDEDVKTCKMKVYPSCNMCDGRGNARYDGKTILGTWAYMCPPCFKRYGMGLGTGKGQKIRIGENV